jgi:multiple sugar transport system ATP-binding protein
MATVETRQVRKHFGDVRAVDGVDLATREGELLVLLGPSGCGKTTLLRMIAGLERPTAGEILIGGRVVNDLPPRARKIAMVFQSYALYPHLTVFDNIAFPLRAQRVAAAEIPRKVEWAASLFGIQHLLRRKPRELSGGERQRVALARALVREPAVFLFDEPLSNLDAKLRAAARDELKQFQRRIGTTTIYVTHDQVEAMGLGDRIAVMDRGRVRQIGTPEDVYEEPADTFVAGFLGSPPMNLVPHGGQLVGFRPEHFLPWEVHEEERGRPVLVPFRVHRVEYLGADRLVYGVLGGRFDGARAIGKLPSTVTLPIAPGQTYQFSVPEKDLKFFDAATGLRTGPHPL